MKKIIKYIIVPLISVLVVYNSVYFKKLSEVKQHQSGKFDTAKYADGIWNDQLIPKLGSVIELPRFISECTANKEQALSSYTHALAIGNYRYALVRVKGLVTAVTADEVEVKPASGSDTLLVHVTTEYVYGNAIRDASGLISIKDFPNTTDLNAVSEAINGIVRKKVLPAFKSQVKAGDKIDMTGAMEINKEHIQWNDLELIPVQIQILK